MVHKFDKIRRKCKDEGSTFQSDELVYIEEKIDGANFRTWIDDNGELRFGSRTVEFFPENHKDVGYAAFAPIVEYIKSLNLNLEYHKPYVFYWEAMIKHSLPYDYDKHPKAILFDVYDLVHDYYEHRVNFDVYVPEECIVPVIFQGEYQEFNGLIPKSKYGDFQAEGFVIKPDLSSRDSHGNIHRAKVVGDKFRE